MKERSSRRLLGIILGVLCVAIVGLTVGIIVVNVRNGDDNQLSPNWRSELSERLDGLGMTDIDEGILIYQEYIDLADGDEKAELYTMRSTWITRLDPKREYGEQVLSDVINADDILQSIDSAINVENTAYSYWNEEIANQYLDIVIERQLSEGATLEELMESEG